LRGTRSRSRRTYRCQSAPRRRCYDDSNFPCARDTRPDASEAIVPSKTV
jgi:hypothetical protein